MARAKFVEKVRTSVKKVTSIGKGTFSRPAKKKSTRLNGFKKYRGQGK